MTVGIYLLKFKGTEKLYVGQSKRIEERYTKHKYRMTNNIASYKLQEAYNKYGLPDLEILISDVAPDELDALELEAINIYDAVNSGFNINTMPGGGSGRQGIKHPNSKYTEEQIVQVLMELTDPETPLKDIAVRTLVPISTVRDISKGKAHRWLKSVHPNEYEYVLNLVGTRPSQNSLTKRYNKEAVLTHPIHGDFTVDNIAKFSEIYGLNRSHVSGVISGKRKSHMGWKLKINPINEENES